MSLTQPYDESALVKRIQSNNQKGFQELYDRFAPAFLRILIKIVHNQEQAEDVLHDSFLKIWLNLHHFDPDKGRLYTWMLTIVRNTALLTLRTTIIYHPIEEIAQDILPVTHLSVETMDLASWVDSTLDATERYMIDLVYFQGYTFKQISDEFGYPLGSVKTYVRRALGHLRNNR